MITNFLLVLLYILPSTFADFPLVPDPYRVATRDDTVNYRLPTDTVPISYDITLEPFFDPVFIFNGDVTIVIEVVTATSLITLHGNALTFTQDDVEVKEQGSSSTLPLTGVEFDSVLDFIKISLVESVEPGTILELSIKYTGVLDSSNRGFYKASYEEDGVTKWFGTTQFEATSARQAFPCYDEPALKAKFTIHITRPSTYNSISNMMLEKSEDLEDGRFTDTFEESVIMSTYLVAFIVSEMDKTTDDIQAVYAAPALIADGRGAYPLDTSIKTLSVMINYTDVPYSINKLYQAAIPNDWFASGAMENWGLVTYRERYLLYKEGTTTSAEKQTIAYIISHELAHQWFGNIVSPFRWNYIWLNEGFATYFEYYATSLVEADMRMMEQIVVRAHQYAMESDSLRTTRAMTTDAQSPTEIRALFDRVAYDKSGAVIRMMEHFLTTEIFQSGLTTYLNTMEFKAATADDLWDGLQATVDRIQPTILGDRTVKDIMETWNTQAGFPVVNVMRSGGEILLTQTRFLLNEADHEYDTVWTIPISYATSSSADFTDTRPTYWLTRESENTGIPVDDDEWIIVNKQETGYYRVNYDVDNWNLIIDHLRSDDFETIHLLNRAQLIDDSLNLARSGRLGYAVVMNLLRYLSNEVDYIPLYSFFRGLPFLNKHLLYTDYYEEFKSFVREILQTAANNLSTEDVGSHTERLNRINVFTWLCRYEDENCVTQMHNKLTSYSGASPDLQSLVYCGGLISSTDIDLKWEYLYDRYQDSAAEYLEKNRIASAMGCSTSIDHINRLLDIVVNQKDDLVMVSSDRTAALSGIYSNSKIGLETTFDYLLSNFDEVAVSFTPNEILTILSGISDRLITEEQKSRLEDFIDTLPAATQELYSVAFATALSNSQANVEWSQKYVQDIVDWLEVYYEVDDETTTESSTTEDSDISTTEEPDITTTEDPDITTTEEPDITTTEDPVITTTEEPDITITEDPVITTTEEPDITTTEDPDITTTEDPGSGFAFTVSIPPLILAVCLQLLT
uniref:APN-like 2 n=1 Tax=Holotrichia parallela TaxID=93412 RepID=A0A2Z2ECW1_HOLPA|nr:APN-like 2 [Holotrichia parallela]